MIQIFVRLLNNTLKVLRFEEDVKVGQIKSIYYPDIPNQFLRVVNYSRYLDDNMTLSECNIENESTLYIRYLGVPPLNIHKSTV